MKTLFLLLSLCLATGAVTADEVYVPDSNPTTGGSNAIPFWAEWSAIQGQIRYQALYTNTQLGNKPYFIHEISFPPNFTGTFSATQFQLRMSHVTTTSLNPMMDLNIPNPVTCFNGPLTYPVTIGKWEPIGLTAGFTYNGVDHLVVDLRYMGGKNVSNSPAIQIGRFRSGLVKRSWAYKNYNATQQSGQSGQSGIKTRFTVSRTIITGSGNPKPGSTVTFDLFGVADAGLPYQAGTSLGAGPIPIDTRKLGLSPDSVLVASVSGTLPMVFADYAGILDAQGKGKAKLNLPNLSALVGVRLYNAFLTLKQGEPSGVKSISNTYTFTISK